MDLLNPPGLPRGLKVAFTIPFCPGSTGFCVHLGVVHPHDELTRCMMSGASPVLVNSNTCDTSPSVSLMSPKLCVAFLNAICGCAMSVGRVMVAIAHSKSSRFFIFSCS